MACQTYLSSTFNLKQVFITGKVLSEAARPQQKVFLHPTDTVVRQRDPLRQVSPPALGHRLFDRFRVFTGLRTTLGCFQLLTGKKRIQLRLPSNSDACSQGSARPHISCHEKDCNGRIYSGVSHFPHKNLQSRQDTSSPNPRILPIHQDQHFHQIGFRPDSGRRGQQEATRPEGIVQDTVKMSAGQRAWLPHLFLTRDQEHIV